MTRFTLLALVLLPGCPGPDMIVTPADSGFLGDAGPQVDAYTAPEQDAGTDAYVPGDATTVADTGADAGPALDPDLDRFEVSWGQWRWFEDAGRPDGSDGQVEAPRADLGCSAGLGDSYPVTCVTQASAEAFCRFQGLRLPTRAEWLAEASAVAQDSDEVTGTTAPQPITRPSVCDRALCDTYGNVAELVVEGLAMGAAYDDSSPGLGERPGAVDPHVGFRCRTL